MASMRRGPSPKKGEEGGEKGMENGAKEGVADEEEGSGSESAPPPPPPQSVAVAPPPAVHYAPLAPTGGGAPGSAPARPSALASAHRSMSVSLRDAVVVFTHNPSKVMRPLGPSDVIFGRGGASNNHVGNRRYRALVSERQPEYVHARKRDKAEIARQIVRAVTAPATDGGWGGMFVRRLEGDEASRAASGGGTAGEVNRWIDVGENRAREKTSQALREGLEVRKTGSGVCYGAPPSHHPPAGTAAHLQPLPSTTAVYGAPYAEAAATALAPTSGPPKKRGRSGGESPDGGSPGKKKRGRPRKSASGSPKASSSPASSAAAAAAAVPGYPAGYPPPPPGHAAAAAAYHPHQYAHPAPHPPHAYYSQYPYLSYATPAAPPTPGTASPSTSSAHVGGMPSAMATIAQTKARASLAAAMKCGACREIVVKARGCGPCGHVCCAECVEGVATGRKKNENTGEEKEGEEATGAGIEAGDGEEADGGGAPSSSESKDNIKARDGLGVSTPACPVCGAPLSGPPIPIQSFDRIVSCAIESRACDFSLEELERYESRWRRVAAASASAAERKKKEEERKGEAREDEGINREEEKGCSDDDEGGKELMSEVDCEGDEDEEEGGGGAGQGDVACDADRKEDM